MHVWTSSAEWVRAYAAVLRTSLTPMWFGYCFALALLKDLSTANSPFSQMATKLGTP